MDLRESLLQSRQQSFSCAEGTLALMSHCPADLCAWDHPCLSKHWKASLEMEEAKHIAKEHTLHSSCGIWQHKTQCKVKLVELSY